MRTLEKMEDQIVQKEVIVIGNGPSGIVVSLLLSGRIPYLTRTDHPDEMLKARLNNLTSSCLLTQDLDFLSQGLEGRTTNPVSLLMDALLHPLADLGYDLEPLLEFRKDGKEIDHVVLGRGPPGGSWHQIDPEVLTLSLGSWMGLPGISFPPCTTNEKRAFARDVAAYYQNYVDQMKLGQYFKNDVLVTSVTHSQIKKTNSVESLVKKKSSWVKKLDRDLVERVKVYIEPVNEVDENSGFLTNAINCLLARSAKKPKYCTKRSKNICHENSSRKLNQNKSEPIVIPKHEKKRSISCCSCCGYTENRSPKSFTHSQSLDTFSRSVPLYKRLNSDSLDPDTPKWIVHSTDVNTGRVTTYTSKYLVLACGAHDSPNRLEIFKDRLDPDWLCHDLRSLETKLDEKAQKERIVDPVVIVGAGLSAADAVMAVRFRNIPVVHVFRGKSAEFTKQLPENMYPEYHKVNQMMNDGGSTYPLYTAYPEQSLIDFDAESRTIQLSSKSGEQTKIKVSFAAILIGSRPSLAFLPHDLNLGVFKNREIDSKTNPVKVNPFSHEVLNYENLFAVGPLAGDNFVRFIPGGAVAVVSELYKRYNLM